MKYCTRDASEGVSSALSRTVRIGTAGLRLSVCALVIAAGGCYESRIVEVDAGEVLETAGDGAQEADAGDGLPEGCEEQYGVPTTLECTGLYSDIKRKKLADGVRMFEPAAKLWSDGANKTRWIKLPEGTKIDTRNMDQWKFPVGTKLWKEFRLGERRVETRLLHKVDEIIWRQGAYQWDPDGNAASATRGGDIKVDGQPYRIPDLDDEECTECHKGGADKVLGFDAIGLGRKGAKGLTLAKLIKEDLLTHPPDYTEVTIPDDGTGKAAEALAYLHVNCGVCCHSSSANAWAKATDMWLRLDVRKLETQPPAKWDALATTLNLRGKTAGFQSETRIEPGHPEKSLIVRLMGIRGSKEQMPPLGTVKVDKEGRQLIIDWIEAMDSER